MISQLSAKYQIGAIHTADTMSIVQTQFGDTPNRCSRRFQVVSWPNLTVLHTQTGYTLKPCTRRFQVVSWPNLTVLHTQTGYKRKPWHRDYLNVFKHGSVLHSQSITHKLRDVVYSSHCSSTLSLRFVISRVFSFFNVLGFGLATQDLAHSLNNTLHVYPFPFQFPFLFTFPFPFPFPLPLPSPPPPLPLPSPSPPPPPPLPFPFPPNNDNV